MAPNQGKALVELTVPQLEALIDVRDLVTEEQLEQLYPNGVGKECLDRAMERLKLAYRANRKNGRTALRDQTPVRTPVPTDVKRRAFLARTAE